jgi:hypothetical protein
MAGAATVRVGLPSATQLAQAFLVSLFAGLIATLIFFVSLFCIFSTSKRIICTAGNHKAGAKQQRT